MNDLEDIQISFSMLNNNNIISLLSYDDDNCNDPKDWKILMSMIRFAEDSQRFYEQLW